MTSYNRYSHHARRALSHASALVVRYRHPRVDTGHLLVGVMMAEGSVGSVVLHDLGLNLESAAPELAALTLPLDAPPPAILHDAALDIALELAADEATWLGHHYVGTEHLLLGITRTNVGNASDLLRVLRVSPEQVRRRIRRALNEGWSEFLPQVTRRNMRFSELSRRVISAAEQHALALAHPNVGIGHLLLALLREQRSPVASVILYSGLDQTRFLGDLQAQAPDLLQGIEDTLSTALELAENGGSHFTGTEHLLLALITDEDRAALFEMYDMDVDNLVPAIVQQLRDKR